MLDFLFFWKGHLPIFSYIVAISTFNDTHCGGVEVLSHSLFSLFFSVFVPVKTKLEKLNLTGPNRILIFNYQSGNDDRISVTQSSTKSTHTIVC